MKAEWSWVYKKSGFSLIELVVVIAIIAILATITIPTIKTLFPKNERKIFLENLNALTFTALNNAILSGKLTRITFDFDKNKILIEEETDKQTTSKEFIFEPLSSKYAQYGIDFPESKFKIQNFYIDNRDEMRLFVNQIKKEKVWFYITPEGVTQVVTLNILDISGAESDQFSFVLNPFTSQFTYYEKFMSAA